MSLGFFVLSAPIRDAGRKPSYRTEKAVEDGQSHL